MEYNYEEVRGGKGNPSIVRFVRGTQEQFDKMIDKTNIIKPDLYMKDNTMSCPTNEPDIDFYVLTHSQNR